MLGFKAGRGSCWSASLQEVTRLRLVGASSGLLNRPPLAGPRGAPLASTSSQSREIESREIESTEIAWRRKLTSLLNPQGTSTFDHGVRLTE